MVDFLRPGMTEFSMRVPDEVREYADRLFNGHDRDAGQLRSTANIYTSRAFVRCFTAATQSEIFERFGSVPASRADAGWKAASRNCANSSPALPPAEPLVFQVPRCVFPAQHSKPATLE